MDKNSIDELRKKVWESQQWPQRYMFKFIVPNEDGKVEKVKGLIPNGAKLSFKHTKDLKHVSITAVSMMPSLEKVKEITDAALAIDGVMAL